MNEFRKNGPLFLKTYGKHKKKVEAWLSPDMRKMAFSTTSTSDLSAIEQNIVQPEKKGKKTISTASSNSTRATRKAKQKALTALREKGSDEENLFIPETGPRHANQKRGVIPMGRLRSKRAENRRALVVSTSESEDDPVIQPLPQRRKGKGQLKQSCCEREGSTEDRMNPRTGASTGSVRAEALPPDLGKFVTNRRRMPLENPKATRPRRMKTKTSVLMSSRSLNSSEDFVKNPPRRVKNHNKELFLEKTDSEIVGTLSNLSGTRNLLKEVSLNRKSDRILKSCYKKPLLSSTPSLVFKPSYRHYDPSISEISFSNDEFVDVFKSSIELTKNAISPRSQEFRILQERRQGLGSSNSVNLPLSDKVGELSDGTTTQHSKELFSRVDCDTVYESRGKRKEKSFSLVEDFSLSTKDCDFVSAKTHLDSLISNLKERCRTSTPVVLLHKVDISNDQVEHSNREQGEEVRSIGCGIAETCNQSGGKFCSDMEVPQRKETNAAGSTGDGIIRASQVCQNGSELKCFDPKSTSALCFSSSASSSHHSELKLQEENELGASCSNDRQHNCVEPSSNVPPPTCSHEAVLEKCLSCLDLSKHIQGNRDLATCARFDSRREHGSEASSHVDAPGNTDGEVLPNCSGWEGTKNVRLQHGSRRSGNCGLRRRLSDAFASKATNFSSDFGSPAAEKRGPGRLRIQGPVKDKSGTGRKACISGLSVSRWAKKDHRQRQKKGTQSLLSGDGSLCDFQLGFNNKKCTIETANSWLQSPSGAFPGTPTIREPLNMSSLLAGFTPDFLNTHTWSRLKAALSVHKKKRAFFTPKKPLSQALRNGMLDGSPELLGTPQSHQLRPCLRNAEASLLTSRDSFEGISDAEKVYHECQQEGPISFEQCIPLNKLKLCKKIGEGTFGEVFSTVNESKETVALKIIPIEGSQKVNGEEQKTFGEILHELIISKELSSLNAKENNKTNGFIGLNNVHCVCGSYPELLLKAWDKFDKDRVSENDRPDLFGDDQLYVILEFEFGGSDLENLDGKLSSVALAKTLLHQVTAALAVAEQALCFEHRDLHWGNILVKPTKEKSGTYILNGISHSFDTKGIHVNIIDYSLSRLEIDDLTVSCDISTDEELFMGKGDYQFDIYRKMRAENNNSWSEYNPHTNVLWLHYLTDKLLHMRYKNKGHTKPMKELKASICKFHSEVLGFKSATNVLECSTLFQ